MKKPDIIYSMQVSSASVSMLSSLFITVAIMKSDYGIASPYRRIIFGLSVADILHLLTIMLGPAFAVPSSSSPVGQWAIGNHNTCQALGFLAGFSAGTTP
jgi:hypothetical protein